MTTFAPDDVTRRLRELDELTRAAWDAYAADLREREGRDYEDAEDAAWDHLQDELRALEAERSDLQGSAPPASS